MARVWVSPEGEVTSTTLFSPHGEIAYDLVEQNFAPEVYHRMIETADSPGAVLLKNGWVRYSNGFVEGQSRYIGKWWPTIRDFAESDVIHFGYDEMVWFDIWDERHRIRSFDVRFSQMLRPQPPAGVFGEPSIVQQARGSYRREEPEVRVRQHTKQTRRV